MKQLHKAYDNIKNIGWNNTDANYLANQGVLISQRIRELAPPCDITGKPRQCSAWDTYEDKLNALKAKLAVCTLETDLQWAEKNITDYRF
jgi:hypothetical protein